jgi:intraflagellar transport protein 56
MIVGASKKRSATRAPKETPEATAPQPELAEQHILQAIDNRDYSAASTYIEFFRDELNHPYTKELALWHGYSLFHLGEYADAIDVYRQLLEAEPDDAMLHLYISSCLFYLREFPEARAEATKGPSVDFRTRLLFHIAHQTNDEQQLFQAHSQLVGNMENQLSLAAIHYMRSNFNDAIEIYRRFLQQHPDFMALNVYIAMCQYKLDQFEDANESVDQYLAVSSDSAVGLNLKACAYLRLFDPEIAESQLLQIRKFSSASYSFVDSLIKHNIVIFHNGEDGFTELPKLVGALNEARFNLAVLYMRQSNCSEAYNLLQKFVPVDINESILKATVWLSYALLTSDAALMEEASQIFSEIGDMDVVRDTVPGRQCLATSKFILTEYEETLRVLQSIEQATGEMDEFNYNRAMALAALSRWAEAERYFLLVKNAQYTKEIFYTSWLCRCYIKNKKPDSAWDLYAEATQAEDAKQLLQVIGADCYAAGAYYYSMKAYDMLAKFEGDPALREGMIASAVGVFRGILSRKEPADRLGEMLAILSGEPEAANTLQAIQHYIDTSGEFETGY